MDTRCRICNAKNFIARLSIYRPFALRTNHNEYLTLWDVIYRIRTRITYAFRLGRMGSALGTYGNPVFMWKRDID